MRQFLRNRNYIQKRCFATGEQRGQTNLTTLSNGLRVLTKKTWDPQTTVGSYMFSGSRDESYDGKGAFQILEGYAKNPNTKKRKGTKDLYTEIENYGATIRSDFGREQSNISLTFDNNSSSMIQSLDIIKDLTFDLDVSNKEHFEEVKQMVIRNSEVNPPTIKDIAMDRMHCSSFRDYSLGYSRYNMDFSMATPQEVQGIIDRSRTSDRTVIVAIGDVEHSNVVSEVEKLYKDVRRGKCEDPKEKTYFCGAWMSYNNEEMGKDCHWVFSHQICPYKHADSLSYHLIAQILGEYTKVEPKALIPGNISHNRLTHICANQRDIGCAEYHKAEALFYRDTGLLTMYGISDENALDEHMRMFQFVLSNMAHALTEEELERAKKEFKMKLFSQHNGTLNLANTLGSQVLSLDRYLPLHEIIERIDSYTADDIMRICYDNLQGAELNVVAFGPTDIMQSHYRLQVRTTSTRY